MSRKETTCSRIKQSWHAISRLYNNEAVNHRLTTTIGFILLNIDSHEGTPSTQIGPLIGMEATGLSRAFKVLEKEKIIKRKRDKKDARIVRIMLTEKGKQKKEIAKRTVKDFNRVIADKLGEKKLAIFNDIIDEITRIAVKQQSNSVAHA